MNEEEKTDDFYIKSSNIAEYLRDLNDPIDNPYDWDIYYGI